MKLALISEVFHGPDGVDRLSARLREAAAAGAELAVLPELPFDPWLPAERTASDDDAEPEGGPRLQTLASVARHVGIGVVGGAILRSDGGARHNTALVVDDGGNLVARYRKTHVPDEPGFREADHYTEGATPPRRVDNFGMPLGLQICSDVNRPVGTLLLAAAGAELVLAPRATEAATWARWRTVLVANALVGSVFVASVNRPAPERGVALGGPSLVVGPDGEVLIETEEPLAVVDLPRAAVAEARARYPGYLSWRSGVYAEGWAGLADIDRHGPRP